MTGARIFLFATLLAALAPGSGVRAGQLVADLSSAEISISTGFAGTELLLFGAFEGAGDVIVVVQGPHRTEIVRRKARIAGIWVNNDSMAFAAVPAFYWVASTRPIELLASPEILTARNIGATRLNLTGTGIATEKIGRFRDALLRNKKRAALYGGGGDLVRVMGGRLFRTTVRFPATVPIGRYLVTVYLLRDGEIVAAQTSNLSIHKSGMEARIYNFAHDSAALYGIICIVIALAAGWAAGIVFRKS